ncbi:MAG TPA: penicillin-binding protein 2 [Actinobacteria bacterium]|nr:penicillin-binding protein 2 [Actinomycetota bacterium]
MIRKDNTKANRRRIIFLFFLFIAVFGLIVYRLVNIQFVFADKYKVEADYQHTGDYIIKSKRGKILDRSGIELASSLVEKTITANPKLIKDEDYVAEVIGEILGIDKERIKEKLSDKERGFVYIERKVDAYIADKISSYGFEGIGIEDECKRFYPQNELASQLIGFTDIDNIGLSGIELGYEELLRGIDGKYSAEKDVFGKIIEADEESYTAPISGSDIVLTIDSGLQFFTENVLAQAAEQYNAPRAICVVMNPGTGEIYSMAQYPTFDLNNYSDYSQEFFSNLGVSFTYEPGSTFKIVNISSAIDGGFVGPDQLFHLSPTIKVGDRIIKETHRTYGIDYTVGDIIKYSSNIGAVTVALAMGSENYYNSIIKFGFGNKTGLNIPGEEKGIIADYKAWPASTIGAIAIGQSISVTPIQLLRAASVIANGGYLVNPYIVKEIHQNNGNIEKTIPDEGIRIISSLAADSVKKMMLQVVESGTGKRAAIEDVLVCGKTGTAQKANKSGIGYSEGRVITSFIGFAPYDDPRIACVVIIDEPQGNEEEIWGGTVAAPLFAEIVEFALKKVN